MNDEPKMDRKPTQGQNLPRLPLPAHSVLIWSKVLEEEVWLIPDRKALEDLRADGEIGRRPVFFYAEIARLKGKDAATLKAIANTKRVFGPEAMVVSRQMPPPLDMTKRKSYPEKDRKTSRIKPWKRRDPS